MKGLRVVAGNDEIPPNQNRLGNRVLLIEHRSCFFLFTVWFNPHFRIDYEPTANWYNWTYRCLPAAAKMPADRLGSLEILKWGTQHDPDATYIKRYLAMWPETDMVIGWYAWSLAQVLSNIWTESARLSQPSLEKNIQNGSNRKSGENEILPKVKVGHLFDWNGNMALENFRLEVHFGRPLKVGSPSYLPSLAPWHGNPGAWAYMAMLAMASSVPCRVPGNLVCPADRWRQAKTPISAISLDGGFLKWRYQTTMGFPTKNDHFGVFWGYHHLRKDR